VNPVVDNYYEAESKKHGQKNKYWSKKSDDAAEHARYLTALGDGDSI
jgi:hypothetical protein